MRFVSFPPWERLLWPPTQPGAAPGRAVAEVLGLLDVVLTCLGNT